MAEEGGVTKGDGYSVSTALVGDGYGFRKLRRELDVTAFGANAIVIPPGFDAGKHLHDEQEELYFVHKGQLEMEFGDGSSHTLGEGGAARVDPATVRGLKNPSDSDDTVVVVVGGKDGYVGRDGKVPEGEDGPKHPGDD